MSWRLHRWVWLLESPLAVGAPPAGSLNRCRLYVPARTLWGALTAELARARARAGRPEYDGMGKTLADDTRLTYLFPAERVGDRWLTWLPQYEEGRGLVWCCEDDERAMTEDRAFRHRLVTTRASTAIDPRSDAAAEGSLRQTECVTDRWRDSGACVAMVGYVFVHEGAKFLPAQDSLIQVGGDTRYGLGRLRCIEFAEDERVFSRAVGRGNEDPQICSRNALAHADTPLEADGEPRGALEALSGWDRGKLAALGDGRPLWAPGSSWERELSWSITSRGTWKIASHTT